MVGYVHLCMKAGIRLLGVGILAIVAGGCSTNSGRPASVLLPPQTYGTGPNAFTISFTKPPTSMIPSFGARPNSTATTPPTTDTTAPPTTSTTTSIPGLPPPLASTKRWSGGDVDVAVSTEKNAIPPHRIESVLRAYLPIATGGRMLLMDGMPAIREVVDCSTPSGPCPGNVGGLEVLDGSTLFDVFTGQLDDDATTKALSSFHVAHVAATPGCSYQVSRKGFTQRCAPSR
jgi:hypothetical protein